MKRERRYVGSCQAGGEGEDLRRFKDLVKEDMKMVGVTVDEAG